MEGSRNKEEYSGTYVKPAAWVIYYIGKSGAVNYGILSLMLDLKEA